MNKIHIIRTLSEHSTQYTTKLQPIIHFRQNFNIDFTFLFQANFEVKNV